MSTFFNTCDAVQNDFIRLPKLLDGVYLKRIEITLNDILTIYSDFDCDKKTATANRLNGPAIEYFNTIACNNSVIILFASYYLTIARIDEYKDCNSESMACYAKIRRIKCDSIIGDNHLVRVFFTYGKKP